MKMSSKFVSRFINRNPRNNEISGRFRPNTGYQFEADRDLKNVVYRVELIESKSHQEARLIHYRDGVVISASSKEPEFAKQLYSKTDTCAALNLGRALALRCLQSGIHFAVPTASQEEIGKSNHQKSFFEALKTEGLILENPAHIEHSYLNDPTFVWERYPLKATRQEKLDELS